MKQTKIVATIGPASESKDTLRKMVEAGMNVVRLNFSHGEHAWHKNVINRVRELSEELHTPIGILADMQGPRIRTETEETIEVKKGTRVRVSDIAQKGNLPKSKDKTIFLDMAGIIESVKAGHAVLIEDGSVELTVTDVGENFVVAQGKNEGTIKNRKGVILWGRQRTSWPCTKR
jgi:pyruvate kinase